MNLIQPFLSTFWLFKVNILVFQLKIWIFQLKIWIFQLKIWIFQLKILVFSFYRANHSTTVLRQYQIINLINDEQYYIINNHNLI